MDGMIASFLRKRGFPDFVVEGGIQKLAGKWEELAASLNKNEKQYYHEYLNDITVREIINAICDEIPDEVPVEVIRRIQAADKGFREKTITTTEPILSREDLPYPSRENQWWYYAMPINVYESDLDLWQQVQR